MSADDRFPKPNSDCLRLDDYHSAEKGLDWEALYTLHPIRDGKPDTSVPFLSDYLIKVLKKVPPSPLPGVMFLNELIHPEELPPDVPVYLPALKRKRRRRVPKLTEFEAEALRRVDQKRLRDAVDGFLYNKFLHRPTGWSQVDQETIRKAVYDEHPALDDVEPCIGRHITALQERRDRRKEKEVTTVTRSPELLAALAQFQLRAENPDIRFYYAGKREGVQVSFRGLAFKMWRFVSARLYDWRETERMEAMAESLFALAGMTTSEFEFSLWSEAKGAIMNIKNDAIRRKMRETAHRVWGLVEDKEDHDDDNFLQERIDAKNPSRMRPNYCSIGCSRYGEITRRPKPELKYFDMGNGYFQEVTQPGAVAEQELSWGVDMYGRVRTGPKLAHPPAGKQPLSWDNYGAKEPEQRKNERVYQWDRETYGQDPGAALDLAEEKKRAKPIMKGDLDFLYAKSGGWSVLELVSRRNTAARNIAATRRKRLAWAAIDKESEQAVLMKKYLDATANIPIPRSVSRTTVLKRISAVEKKLGKLKIKWTKSGKKRTYILEGNKRSSKKTHRIDPGVGLKPKKSSGV